jgi:hypothetical protein
MTLQYHHHRHCCWKHFTGRHTFTQEYIFSRSIRNTWRELVEWRKKIPFRFVVSEERRKNCLWKREAVKAFQTIFDKCFPAGQHFLCISRSKCGLDKYYCSNSIIFLTNHSHSLSHTLLFSLLVSSTVQVNIVILFFISGNARKKSKRKRETNGTFFLLNIIIYINKKLTYNGNPFFSLGIWVLLNANQVHLHWFFHSFCNVDTHTRQYENDFFFHFSTLLWFYVCVRI